MKDNKLPFLNTLVEIVDNSLTIDVYRKPSSTMRLIPIDSHHDLKHKMTAFHSMAHFMVNLPLTQEKVDIETKKIVKIGRVNGYGESTILHIVKKHQRKKALREFSTFYESSTRDEPAARIGIKYFPKITSKLKPFYRSHKLELVQRSDFSLKNALGSIKDVPPDLHKSGIYRIMCNLCGICYFGMSSRKLFVRFLEHIKSANWKNKSAIGRHISISGHSINISDLSLVQEVRQIWKLELYEANDANECRRW